MWLPPNFYKSPHTDMGGSTEHPRTIWCKPLEIWAHRSPVSTEGSLAQAEG